MEATSVSTNRQVDKEDVVQIYNGILAIKSEILPFVTRWMDLKDLMLSEISQTKKYKYYMISLIRGI